MKCPKCGNLIHEQTIQEFTVLNGEPTLVKEQTSIIAVPPELTTAEKLLWLAENFDIETTNLVDGKNWQIQILTERVQGAFCCFRFSNAEQSINAAYGWVKQRTVDTNKTI